MNSITRFILTDLLRNKFILIYTLGLAALSWSIFALEDNSTKGILSLLNIILLITPLVSVLFSTIYIYNSAEFIELLLSQPIRRSRIWNSLFVSLLLSFTASFIIAAGIPIILFVDTNTALVMLLSGVFISAIFVSLAFLCSIVTRDKARGIGLAVMSWLYTTLLFDTLVLFLLFQFADYPIEGLVAGLTISNPVDLSRILILLQLDTSALMGYTGAIFNQFIGNTAGMVIAIAVLSIWWLVPYYTSLRKFNRKDL